MLIFFFNLIIGNGFALNHLQVLVCLFVTMAKCELRKLWLKEEFQVKPNSCVTLKNLIFVDIELIVLTNRTKIPN